MGEIQAAPSPYDPATPDWVNLRLQCYLAEYQALMVRGTSYLTLEFSSWVLMAGVLGAVLTVWDSARSTPRDLLVWGAFALLQIITCFALNTLYEHYQSIVYIERQLQPKVAALVCRRYPFGYERYIGRLRPSSQPFWYDAAPAFGAFLVHIAIVCFRFGVWNKPWEYYELGVNFVLSCAVAWGTIRMVKVRRQLTLSAKRSPKRLLAKRGT